MSSSRRRSLLFIPGNNPGMLVNGSIFGSDSVIFDLEDATALSEKDSARILVRNALRTLDYEGIEKIIRINGLDTPFWKDDLEMIVPAGADTIMVPKVQGADDVLRIENAIAPLEGPSGESPIEIIPLIESAIGIERALEIATAGERITALFLGAEDLTANLGARRSRGGREIFYARSRIVMAARAAGIMAIDTPFTDVDDEKGLSEDTILARDLGFSGKAVISPRHVPMVNDILSPSKEDIAQARRIMEAISRGKAEGRGVVSLDGRMVDAPVVERARRILIGANLLKENEI